MNDITSSAPTNRLIKLLMMLPSPCNEDTFAPFWEEVAQDLKVDTSYVTDKISTHLRLLLGDQNSDHHRENLAGYALDLFGEAGDQLVMSIATEVNTGAPDSTAGQVWVQELRNAAFAVMEETFPQERINEAVDSWLRFDHMEADVKTQVGGSGEPQARCRSCEADLWGEDDLTVPCPNCEEDPTRD